MSSAYKPTHLEAITNTQAAKSLDLLQSHLAFFNLGTPTWSNPMTSTNWQYVMNQSYGWRHQDTCIELSANVKS